MILILSGAKFFANAYNALKIYIITRERSALRTSAKTLVLAVFTFLLFSSTFGLTASFSIVNKDIFTKAASVAPKTLNGWRKEVKQFKLKKYISLENRKKLDYFVKFMGIYASISFLFILLLRLSDPYRNNSNIIRETFFEGIEKEKDAEITYVPGFIYFSTQQTGAEDIKKNTSAWNKLGIEPGDIIYSKSNNLQFVIKDKFNLQSTVYKI